MACRIAVALVVVVLLVGVIVPSSMARPIAHAGGVTDVDGMPMRVVALEYRYVEDLIALGITPVGVADLAGYIALVGIGADKLDQAANVGTRQEPNLEAIVALAPDLIIGANVRHRAIYDRLTAIAPTLLFHYTDLPASGPRQFDYMKQEFSTIGAALNRSVAATEVLAHLDLALGSAQDKLAASGLTGHRFAFVQFLDGAPRLRLFTDSSIATQLLQAIGLENAWHGRFERFGYNVAGVEALLSLGDAHVLYIMYGRTYYEQLVQNPVWQRLAFVEAGRAHKLPAHTWPFGGPLSAESFIARAVRLLTSGN